VDESSLLEFARKNSRLTQAQVARLAGTSQAAVSSYERGLKTPSLRVAARMLKVTGWELALQRHVDFVEHHPKGIVAFWVPNRLWRVPTPECFATVSMPDLINHTPQNKWDLRDRVDRLVFYELLIRRGVPEQMVRWLDGALLVELWEHLDLPTPVRRAWEPAIESAATTGGRARDALDPLWSSTPGVAPLARIRQKEPLPPPPPRLPRRSRFDPRPPPKAG
jgi:transcriptional regulator with XRE-family HTH domain